MLFDDIVEKIREERHFQDIEFGDQVGNSDFRWNSILSEEVGEASMELNDGELDELEHELIQVAAVAVAWLEAIARRKDNGNLDTMEEDDYGAEVDEAGTGDSGATN